MQFIGKMFLRSFPNINWDNHVAQDNCLYKALESNRTLRREKLMVNTKDRMQFVAFWISHKIDGAYNFFCQSFSRMQNIIACLDGEEWREAYMFEKWRRLGRTELSQQSLGIQILCWNWVFMLQDLLECGQRSTRADLQFNMEQIAGIEL